MFSSKSIKALAVLSSCVSVGAFTAPKPSLGTYQRISSFAAPSQAQYQPAPHLSYEHSLQFWKNDNGGKTSAIESYTDDTLGQKDEVPNNVLGFVGFALLGFSYVVERLQVYLNTPCLNEFGPGSNICTAQYHDFAQFFGEHEAWSYLLVLTHAIPFALLPWVSKQVSEQGRIIQKDFKEFNPFIMQMAMACMGFGLSLEFGWHVADSW